MKKLLPIFISVLIIISSVLSANASENILRGVDVVKSANSYTIEVSSLTPAKMTKTIVSENRVLVNLRDVKISRNLTTKFNGKDVLDNVMVEPCGENSVNILVQGDGVALSSVEFKEITPAQRAADSLKNSVSSLITMYTDSSLPNRCVQFGTLFIFMLIFMGELGFIKSKYDELQKEKQELLNNIERTKDFKDYLPDYDYSTLKKPYTTPIYTKGANSITSKSRVGFAAKLPEKATLNIILSKREKQSEFDRIINSKPMFGELSGISTLNTNVETLTKTVSNPLDKARLKTNLRYLEALTAIYKNKSEVSSITSGLRTRLNKIY